MIIQFIGHFSFLDYVLRHRHCKLSIGNFDGLSSLPLTFRFPHSPTYTLEHSFSRYWSEELVIDSVSVFDTVELREGAKVVRVSRVGKTLNMDMACAKIARKDSNAVEVRLCFANAKAYNCQPDVASTVVNKLQASLDNELRGLEWGGAAEVARLTAGLKEKIQEGVKSELSQ